MMRSHRRARHRDPQVKEGVVTQPERPEDRDSETDEPVTDATAEDIAPIAEEAGLEQPGAGGGPGMHEQRERGDQTDFGAREPGVAADLDGPEGSDGVGGLEGPEGGTDVGPETWRTREGPTEAK
jgi:hypothetical protein